MDIPDHLYNVIPSSIIHIHCITWKYLKSTVAGQSIAKAACGMVSVFVSWYCNQIIEWQWSSPSWWVKDLWGVIMEGRMHNERKDKLQGVGKFILKSNLCPVRDERLWEETFCFNHVTMQPQSRLKRENRISHKYYDDYGWHKQIYKQKDLLTASWWMISLVKL